MGVGLVADQGSAIVHHAFRQIGVQVIGHADWHVGRNLANGFQQTTFAIVIMFRHHGPVQVQEHQVTAIPHGVQNGVRHQVIGIPRYLAGRHRLRRQRRDDFRACHPGQFQIRAKGHGRAVIGGQRRIPQMAGPALKARPVCHHR